MYQHYLVADYVVLQLLNTWNPPNICFFFFSHFTRIEVHVFRLCKNFEQVVKVADFGVARVQTQSGVMTAETGTYRWMAPEV